VRTLRTRNLIFISLLFVPSHPTIATDVGSLPATIEAVAEIVKDYTNCS